ncbi:MAG: hypothetical protein GY795_23060 [Desulfobacterales bacterium]|nr:hypothetical protein [Desulfobacterales bacterium]
MTQKDKISPEFLEHLNRLGPKQTIRIIAMLLTKDRKQPSKVRLSPIERDATMKGILKSGEQALIEIDAILDQYGGRKLAPKPNALGCIPIETTARGIKALASLDKVKAIMEDKPISLPG